MTAALTVVVPVFGRASELDRCLGRVLRPGIVDTPFDLLVIDDGSEDAEVDAVLTSHVAAGGAVDVTIERNDRNLGFVATANRALREVAGDVVLLNSDTAVTDGWLDRLASAAAGPMVATVTPLTNEGSICSLPRDICDAFGLFGPEPRIDEMGHFVAASSAELRPDVISGVGFCMYLTRRAIDDVGLFDEESFGRGYGEEVDFCLRATALGWHHVVEDSTYVHHAGGSSFGDDADPARARASAVLHERHPDFRAANRAERLRDPLGPVVAALRFALHPRDERRPHVLHVLHQPSALGGTEKHLDALIAELTDIDASILAASPAGAVLRTRWRTDDGREIRHELLIGDQVADPDVITGEPEQDSFRSVLELFRFDAVHIHNLIGHSLAPLDVLADFDGPVICTVHDYYLACPHHWLLYRNQVACGIPDDLTVCATCLPETRGLSAAHLERFRSEVRAGLDTVDRWVFPSRSAADQVRGLYDIDEARVTVVPHGTIAPVDPRLREVDRAHVLDAPLRIAFVGRGWAKKGLVAANDLADALHGTSIEVHHFGELKEAASPHLILHGAYASTDAPRLLREHGIHIVWMPGPYAETFGLVMTEALMAGLPVMGPPYGAIGERIRDLDVGWVAQPDDAVAMAELVRNLDAGRFELLRATERAATVPLETIGETVGTYAAMYGARVPSPDHVREVTTPNAGSEP